LRLIIKLSDCIGIDWSRKLQSSHLLGTLVSDKQKHKARELSCQV